MGNVYKTGVGACIFLMMSCWTLALISPSEVDDSYLLRLQVGPKLSNGAPCGHETLNNECTRTVHACDAIECDVVDDDDGPLWACQEDLPDIRAKAFLPQVETTINVWQRRLRCKQNVMMW